MVDSELGLVVILSVDLLLEPLDGLLLHPPDVRHAQLQPRVHRAEHHPARVPPHDVTEPTPRTNIFTNHI